MKTYTIQNAYPANVESEFRAEDEQLDDHDVLLIMPKITVRSAYGVKGPHRTVVRSSQIADKQPSGEIESAGGESLQLYNYTIQYSPEPDVNPNPLFNQPKILQNL